MTLYEMLDKIQIEPVSLVQITEYLDTHRPQFWTDLYLGVDHNTDGLAGLLTGVELALTMVRTYGIPDDLAELSLQEMEW